MSADGVVGAGPRVSLGDLGPERVAELDSDGQFATVARLSEQLEAGEGAAPQERRPTKDAARPIG